VTSGPTATTRSSTAATLPGGQFIAFWLRSGQVVAAMNVNVWDVTGPIQALIRSGAVIDPDRLAAPDTALGQLIATTP
jgi:3-phenylpropionate/trans-cinnamate dioxygenase ferredoxin reductase subunit